MNGLRVVALFFGVTLGVFSLAACTSNRIGLIKQHSYQIAKLDQETLGDIYQRPFQFDPFIKGPKPIPGRLLVQIKARYISQRFNYSPPGNKEVRRIFPYLRAFPAELPLRDAKEVKQLDNGTTVVWLHMEKASTPERIKQLLMNTPFKFSERTTLIRTKQKRLDMVMVEVRLDQFELRERRLGFRNYPELQRYSDLHKAFHELDVRSIRRVFRMVERTKGKGGYQVVTMKSLMSDAKSKYPQRARRGYDHVRLPHNMENWFLLRLDRKVDLDKAAKILSARPEIEAVLFDYPVEFHLPPEDEPLYNSDQWAFHATASWGIDVQPVWTDTASNPEVTVAVIDSGIKEDLDEIKDSIWQNPDEIPGNGIDDDNGGLGNGYIDDVSGITTAAGTALGSSPPVVGTPHATKMAGIIAAAVNNNLITGVAGNANVRLMNISLSQPQGCADLAEAITYATLEGAGVINMSLGHPPSHLVEVAIQNALSTQGGVILVASAGNGKQRVSQDYSIIGPFYPAWYDGVIAVGGTDVSGQLWSDPDMGSNFGTGLDLVAPAKDVTTITYSNPTQTVAEVGTVTGTSASAALVSGVAALLIGKYPNLTAAEVRSWLRATSTDLIDPLGTGANLVGDDIYTGAGLLTASAAIPATEPEPLVVDLYVEKICNGGGCDGLNGGVGNGVAASPDLGITVQGNVDSWELHYGVGDSPNANEWILIDNIPPALAGAVDVPRYDISPYIIDVADVHNGVPTNLLDTEASDLTNRQIYTMRLTATDTDGLTYPPAYDWFMPLRAMLVYPLNNTPVPVRWGWPEIDGVVDTRSNARYSISISPMSDPSNPVWQLNSLTSLLGTTTNRGAQFTRLAVPAGTYAEPQYPYPELPTSIPASTAEGEYQVRLEVESPEGNVEVDTQQIHIDNSSFAVRSGWPVNTAPSRFAATSNPHGIEVAEIDGNGQYRIFIQLINSFLCLTPAGSVEWEKPIHATRQDLVNMPRRYPPAFLVEDLDGDNTKEIAVVHWEPGPYWTGPRTMFVELFKPDGTSYDDTIWPVAYPATAGNVSIGKLAAGDVDGDGTKEIIFYERPATASPGETGKLHALTLINGQEAPGWPVSTDPYRYDVPIVADIDDDGQAEILLDRSRTLYEGDGQPHTGWPSTSAPPVVAVNRGGIQVRQLDTFPELEVIEYGISEDGSVTVDVRNHNGSRFSGSWPVSLGVPVRWAETYSYREIPYTSGIYLDTAQLIGDINSPPEIVVAYDKIQVLMTDGSLVSEFDLNGESKGLKVMDVDGDGDLEYVVMLIKNEDDDGYKKRAYANIEAYEQDGTPLSMSNNDDRWPIRVAFLNGHHAVLGNSAAIDDIDGDTQLEVISILGVHPYRYRNRGMPLRGGLELPRKIEVLDIR